MDHDELHQWSRRAADWTRDYYATLRDRPVRSRVRPGETAARLPAAPPEKAEPIARIFDDFADIVPDAMTHWQHPRFFAYFPANAAPASVLAEQLTAALAAQAMLWQTSPAATEIEQVMVGWLRRALGLAPGFSGTIQDSASTATLCAVLTMRERALAWSGLDRGLAGGPQLRIYASDQRHVSVDRAVRMAGIGQENLVRVATGADLSMCAEALAAEIASDLSAGHRPAGLILSVGGTSVGGTDRIAPLIAVARRHDLYVHVDAAWAGSAMICGEFRPLWDGVDGADSVVVNPHKWLGAQFDCSVQFLADPGAQRRTLGLRPDYLQTPQGDDTENFSELTVPLGRRFRALKLWFVLRAYGLEDLRRRIRNHVAWATEVRDAIAGLPGFEIVTEPVLSLFTFRFRDDARTRALLDRVNDDGRVYLSGTVHDGRFVIRVQIGQFDCTRDDAMTIPAVLAELTG